MSDREAMVNALDMYEARLRFIDVYDSLIEKVITVLQEQVAWERQECAALADYLSTQESWATASMAAQKIRER